MRELVAFSVRRAKESGGASAGGECEAGCRRGGWKALSHGEKRTRQKRSVTREVSSAGAAFDHRLVPADSRLLAGVHRHPYVSPQVHFTCV